MTNRKLALAVLATILAGTATPALATTTTKDCKPFSAIDAKDRFERWNASLASGTADAVALWYAPDAKLQLAIADKPIDDQRALRQFYEGAMLKGLKAEVKERKPLEVACNVATDRGVVEYTHGGKTVKAEFKKVYEVQNGVWLIKEHQSTVLR